MKCPHCGCENPNSYKYCHDCGCPLNYSNPNENYNFKSNINQNNFGVRSSSLDNKKLIIIGYIIAILWMGDFITVFIIWRIWIFRLFRIVFPRFYVK